MSHTDLHTLFVALLVGVIITSFFILPFWWAVFALVFISVLSPTLGAILYTPFRDSLVRNSVWIRRVSGLIEGMVLLGIVLVLRHFFGVPDEFFWVVVAIYSANQLARAFRAPGGDSEELNQLGTYLVVTIFGMWI